MGKEASKGNDEQRRKSAKKKSVDQPKVDDVVEPSEAPPSRVHIFKKSPRRDSSKSDGGRLQCSLPGRSTVIDPASGGCEAAIFPSDRPLSITFEDEVLRLKGIIERGKKMLYEAAMKAEGLEGLAQKLQRTCQRISKKRQ